MPGWDCTMELAVKSDPADFETGDKLLAHVEQTLEEISTGFTDAGSHGWEGIDGEYANGLQFIANVVGKQVVEMSRRAVALAHYHGRAAATLGPLQTESDNLLIDAEAAHAVYTAADTAYESLCSSVAYWQSYRDRQPGGTDEWNGANSTLAVVGAACREQARLRDAAIEELDALELTFETLREDERAAHQRFADSVDAVNLETTQIDVDVDGLTQVSFDMVLDLFDAALVPLRGGHRATTVNAQISRLRAARRAIGAMDDIDLDQRDARIADVRHKREFAGQGADEIGERIQAALRAGDAGEARHLARMLTVGVALLGHDERPVYLEQLTSNMLAVGVSPRVDLLVLFALTPGDMPAWMASDVLNFDDHFGSLSSIAIVARDMLADQHGVASDDPDLSRLVMEDLTERTFDSANWPAVIDGWLNGDIWLGDSQFPRLLLRYYTEQPDAMTSHLRLAEEDEDFANELQTVLDKMGHADDDAGMQALVEALVEANFPDGSVAGGALQTKQINFLNNMATLQGAIGEIGNGGASLDWTGIAKVAVTTAATTYVGPVSGLLTKAVLASFAGYTPPVSGNTQGRDNYMLAMAIGLRDPVLGPQLLTAFEGHAVFTSAAEALPLTNSEIDDFIVNGGLLASEISVIAENIEQARDGNPG